MKKINPAILVILIMWLIVVACGISFDTGGLINQGDSNQIDQPLIEPQAAIPSNIEEAIPSNIEEAIPSNVEEAIPSNLKLQVDATVCNKIGQVVDVTIPDGTSLSPGQVAEKTWEITNGGSCTWDTGYALKYHSGDALGAITNPMYLQQSVPPGQSIRLTVRFKAPADAGTYRSNWILMDGSRKLFGIGSSGFDPFWISIQVGSTGAEQPSGGSGGSPPVPDSPSDGQFGESRITSARLYIYDEYGYVDTFYVAPDFSYATAILNRCGYVEPRWEFYWEGTENPRLKFDILSATDTRNTFEQSMGQIPYATNPIVLASPWNMPYSWPNPYHNTITFEISMDDELFFSGTMDIEISCPPDTY